MDDHLARILAFERRVAERIASQVRDLPFGMAVFTPELSSVYDLNHVRVERPVTASELIAAADEVHASAGVSHRKIHVDDPDIASDLAAELTAAGYGHELHEVMILGRDAAPVAAIGQVAELDLERYVPLYRELTSYEPWADTEEILDQFEGRLRALAVHAGARFFAAPSGEPASGCLLLTDGELAEIDDVETLPDHRRRGYSRAVVTHALTTARTAGLDPIFLLADAADWPREWYGRLGFETVSTVHEFTRRSLSD